MIDQQRVTLTRTEAQALSDLLMTAPDGALPDDLIAALDSVYASASDDVAQLIITIAQG